MLLAFLIDAPDGMTLRRDPTCIKHRLIFKQLRVLQCGNTTTWRSVSSDAITMNENLPRLIYQNSCASTHPSAVARAATAPALPFSSTHTSGSGMAASSTFERILPPDIHLRKCHSSRPGSHLLRRQRAQCLPSISTGSVQFGTATRRQA